MIAAFKKDRKPERKPGLTRHDLEEVILPFTLIGVYCLAAYAALKHRSSLEDNIPEESTARSFVVIERVTIISSIEGVIDAA